MAKKSVSMSPGQMKKFLNSLDANNNEVIDQLVS
jgi:hypothetical protein